MWRSMRAISGKPEHPQQREAQPIAEHQDTKRDPCAGTVCSANAKRDPSNRERLTKGDWKEQPTMAKINRKSGEQKRYEPYTRQTNDRNGCRKQTIHRKKTGTVCANVENATGSESHDEEKCKWEPGFPAGFPLKMVIQKPCHIQQLLLCVGNTHTIRSRYGTGSHYPFNELHPYYTPKVPKIQDFFSILYIFVNYADIYVNIVM